jgi:hypothetical protein
MILIKPKIYLCIALNEFDGGLSASIIHVSFLVGAVGKIRSVKFAGLNHAKHQPPLKLLL